MQDYTPRRHRKSRYDDYASPDDGMYYRRDDYRSRPRSLDYDDYDRRGTALAVRPREHHSSRGRASSLDRRDYRSSRNTYDQRNHHNQTRQSHRGHGGRQESPHRARDPDAKRHDEKLHNNRKMEHAAKAAADAAAVEFYRLREAPGDWIGPRGARVATAAIGAAIIDGLRDRDPDKLGKRTLIESTVGGLVANRLVNGPRKDLKRR